MKNLLKVILVTVIVMAVSVQTTDAAEWGFHFSYPGCPGGTLQVWRTINCHRIGPPIFEDYAHNCQWIKGKVPHPPYNDIIFDFYWDFWCHNEDHIKLALPGWHGSTSKWRLRPLPPWIDAYVRERLYLPSVGDPCGIFTNIYAIVDINEWNSDPRPYQNTYDVCNGVCPNLPGYLIGTTPIVFDSNAGQMENPFSTTPLTGTLYRDGEASLTPTETPTVSEWGLIVMAAILVTAGVVVIVRRSQHVTA